MAQLRIQLLGEIAVFQNGVNLLSGRRNTRAMLLLAYLLLHRGETTESRVSRSYFLARF
jgi:DNA-binding SARP family transcriptional activator